MIVSPLSGLYLYLSTNFNSIGDNVVHTKREKPDELDESLIDLGNENEHRAKEGKPMLKEKEYEADAIEARNRKQVLSNKLRINTHLFIATSVAIVGFVQSVIGIYGEGQFAS